MEKLIYLSLVICLSFPARAQDGLDNIWLFGNSLGSPLPTGYGRTVIDFNTLPPQIFEGEIEDWGGVDFLDCNASICDEGGSLLFYTNGLLVANPDHGLMENGAGLNPGQYHDDMLGTGYRVWQGAFIVPAPGQPNLYYLFHADREYSTLELPGHSPHLYYSLVDMSANGGLGTVVEKNVVVVEDTLSTGKLTGIRHANGRDWWIVFHKDFTNEYYRIHVSPDGVANLGKGSTGIAVPREGLGQAVFSPDGGTFARLNSIDLELGQYLDIYRFDRCSGLLADHVQINYNDTAYAAGLAISPNSRYLYVSSHRHIYQYDLGASDVAASGALVATYDGFTDGQLPTRFYLAQLAPDGKIYICADNGVRYLHVIHNPDSPCPDCNIEQHGVFLPTHNAFTMPNFPNYRLGPLDGSPCDTLGLDNVPVAKFRYEQDPGEPLRILFTDLSHHEPADWDWDFGDGAGSGSQHSARKYLTGGAYEVCLTVSNANGADTLCRTIQVGTVATGEAAAGMAATIFPNPASGGVNVILPEGILPLEGRFALYDQLGRPCLSLPVRGGWNSILLEGVLPGMYFYEVRDGEARLGSGKLVVGQ